jgi:arsenate reductase
MVKKITLLFICTHNSARSQMAEAIINNFFSNHYRAFSAGNNPTNVNPYTKEVLKEIGIDVSNIRSKSIEEFRGKNFDYVITVCDHAKESCPFFPGEKIIHKSFEDPVKYQGENQEILDKFRKVRDDIKLWIESDLLDIH